MSSNDLAAAIETAQKALEWADRWKAEYIKLAKRVCFCGPDGKDWECSCPVHGNWPDD